MLVCDIFSFIFISVRCLIMQSFLNINWETHGSYAKQIPEKFILGPLIQGLNDVAHHKDFGKH